MALRWEARREEARALLEGVLAPRVDGGALLPDVRAQLERLLEDEWLSTT